MFEDRLVNNEDRKWFESLLQSKLSQFESNPDEIIGTGPLLYGDFINPNADPRIYDELVDIPKVCLQVLCIKQQVYSFSPQTNSDDTSDRGVPRGLQPGQHCSDEAGSLLGCRLPCVSYLTYHPSATG